MARLSLIRSLIALPGVALVVLMALPLPVWAQVSAPALPKADARAAGAEAGAGAAAEAAVGTGALIKAMDLDSIIAIMRSEGVAYGARLQGEMFPARGGAGWRAQVGLIYRPDHLLAIFTPRFEAALAGRDTAPMLAFFTSDLGRRIITLEVSARRAQLDKAIEAGAGAQVAKMRAAGDPRLKLIGEFIDANDLIELNVVGALNSNFAFYRGLEQGRAFPEDMTEAQMLRDVWAQEDGVRKDTEDWLYSYLTMAYQPLSDADLRRYIAFSRSPDGRALNGALFAAFDAMFDKVSRQLGLAAAGQITGQDL